MVFFCGSVYFGQLLSAKLKNDVYFFSITISLGTLGFHGTPVEKPWSRQWSFLARVVEPPRGPPSAAMRKFKQGQLDY
jgi:hypothetical protein